MTKKSWDKTRIKYELERAGLTLSGLAELKGLNPNNFRAVWSRTNRPAQEAISEALRVPVEELFPDRYPIRKSRILHSEFEQAIASQKAIASANRIAA